MWVINNNHEKVINEMIADEKNLNEWNKSQQYWPKTQRIINEREIIEATNLSIN
jgi:hypothetical protein